MQPMTRAQWLKLGTKKQRRQWATEHPLAWVLEYQPTILLPGQGEAPFEPYPFQQEFLNCRDKRRAINKPRQCGISTTVAAEVAWEFDNVPGAQIMIVSKDLDAAINFHQYVYSFLYSVRRNNPDAPKLIKTNERVTTNSNGARIVSLAASKEAGRSFSPTHFVFDEAAFAQYDDDIWQAASSALAKTRGRATVISTPKGRANFFARIFEDSGHLGFTVFNYGWWDVPDYNPFYLELTQAASGYERRQVIDKARSSEWYIETRAGKTDLQWRQEFEGAFDANVGTVFSTRQLEKAFVRNYLELKNDPDSIVHEWWTTDKEEKHDYAVGVDLGRKNDATVLITYDITETPARLVDYKYIEPGGDWRDIIKVLQNHFEFWDPVAAKHDGTGVGDIATQEIEQWSEPFFFTSNTKQNIIEGVQHAFGKPAVRLPKIETLFQEHQKYLWDDKHIVQDTVMANALAISSFSENEGLVLGYEPSVNFVEQVA